MDHMAACMFGYDKKGKGCDHGVHVTMVTYAVKI